MIRFPYIVAACAAAVLASSGAMAQKPKLDAAVRARAIEGVLRCLNESYVFPEVAKKMEKAVRERAANKAYEALDEGDALAEQLTQDLRAVSHDLHLRVSYSGSVLPPESESLLKPTSAEMREMRRVLARENFGFGQIDILKGNIGYIRFNYFAPPEIAGDTYSAALNYVANTDALILDLRWCNGSMSEDALPMLCGYFFESAMHLNDIYWRSADSIRQSWSWTHVPGKRYFHKPIYVLTSGKTFSGAEELAYDLKNLKRATLIGDVTGGGANGGGPRRADDHFSVWVPNGRAINPITKTNWEGTGVIPDIAVPATQALRRAHLVALKQSLATTQDTDWKATLQNVLSEVEQSQPQLKKVTFILKGYPDAKQVTVAGAFNFWAMRANPLTRKGDAWVGEVEAEPGRHPYKFIVDGRWLLDPANPVTEKDGEHTNSILVVP